MPSSSFPSLVSAAPCVLSRHLVAAFGHWLNWLTETEFPAIVNWRTEIICVDNLSQRIMCCEANWAHTVLLFLWRFCDAHKALIFGTKGLMQSVTSGEFTFPSWVLLSNRPSVAQVSNNRRGKRRKTSHFSSMLKFGSEIWAAPEEKAGRSVWMRDLKTRMTTVTQYYNQGEPVKTLSWPESQSEKKEEDAR